MVRQVSKLEFHKDGWWGAGGGGGPCASEATWTSGGVKCQRPFSFGSSSASCNSTKPTRQSGLSSQRRGVQMASWGLVIEAVEHDGGPFLCRGNSRPSVRPSTNFRGLFFGRRRHKHFREKIRQKKCRCSETCCAPRTRVNNIGGTYLKGNGTHLARLIEKWGLYRPTTFSWFTWRVSNHHLDSIHRQQSRRRSANALKILFSIDFFLKRGRLSDWISLQISLFFFVHRKIGRIVGRLVVTVEWLWGNRIKMRRRWSSNSGRKKNAEFTNASLLLYLYLRKFQRCVISPGLAGVCLASFH